MMDTGKVIADTNVVAYLMKGTSLGQRYKRHLSGKVVGIVFVTVAELYYGAERNNWGEQKRKLLEEHLKNFVVLPYNNEIAKAYARIVVDRERQASQLAFQTRGLRQQQFGMICRSSPMIETSPVFQDCNLSRNQIRNKYGQRHFSLKTRSQ